jgi:hypothetical protein
VRAGGSGRLCDDVLDHAERELLAHHFVHPGTGLQGPHLPGRRTGREDLHEREADPVELTLERLSDGFLSLDHPGRLVHRHPFQVGGAVQHREHLADPHWVTGQQGAPPNGRRGGHLVDERRRRHLAAGHAVHTVVHKDHADVLAPVGGVEPFGGADSGEVAVTLVREHQVLRPDPLDARGHGRAPPVRRLDHVDVEVVVEEHPAAGRSHADGLLGQVHLLDDLHQQAVDDAVATSRAVVEMGFLQQAGALVDGLHGYFPVRAACA